MRQLLRIPGALAFFISGALGRVGIAMTSLGLVWLVHARTDAYAIAGIVAGGFAVTEALAGPQSARLIDRYGQTRVLPFLLVGHGLSALLLVTAGPPWLLAAAGILMGATIPQLGALSAARWAELVSGPRLVTAFSLESTANAVAYLVGPALVTAVAASGHAPLGALLAATFLVGGGLCFAAQTSTAPQAFAKARKGSLWHSGFMQLVLINVAIGGFFGAMRVSVSAYGGDGLAPVLFTVANGAGLLGGWLFGLRWWRPGLRASGALLASGAGLTLVASPWAGIVLTGLAIPMILTHCSALTEASVPRPVLTQAFTWLNSASMAGTAALAGVTGWAVDGFGAGGGFLTAGLAAAAVFCLAPAARRSSSPG